MAEEIEIAAKKQRRAQREKLNAAGSRDLKTKLVVILVGIAVVLSVLITLKTFKISSGADVRGNFVLHTFEPITVNIPNTYHTRHLSATVCVKLDNKKAREQLLNIEPKFIDLLHSILGSKQIEELNVQGQENLRGRIRNIFNSQKELTGGKVLDVYFTEFITN